MLGLNGNIAAVNQSQYMNPLAELCGACAKVEGPSGSVTVQIVDRCPECAQGDLDFDPGSFGQIAEMSAGRVPISWCVAPCSVSGNVSYRFKEGSSANWVQVQVRNHRLPVSKLEYSTDNGGSWKPTQRMEHNYFESASGFGNQSVLVRLTATTGAAIEDTLPVAQSNLDVQGSVQF